MRVLFIGDLVGEAGLAYLEKNLNRIRTDNKINLVFVNGENVHNGKGISLKDYKRLMNLNIACVTLGNHAFRCSEVEDFIDGSKIIRPLNMQNKPGKGYIDINYNGKIITVLNLIGTNNMSTNGVELVNPYPMAENFADTHKFDYLIVDYHAELTSEKIAMGYFLDGKASAVLGTHTHVQTNDARRLDNGTLFITDVGMTGPLNGVLGVKKEVIIDRFRNNGCLAFSLDEDPRVQFNAVVLDFNQKKITPIHLV